MSLDELLVQMRRRRLILISPEEGCWPSPCYTSEIQKAIRRHRKGLRALLRWSSVQVCCSPTWHRRYWAYKGQGRFVCEICEQLSEAIA